MIRYEPWPAGVHELDFESNHAVRVRVLDAEGRPVVGASLSVIEEGGTVLWQPSTRGTGAVTFTDERGERVLQHLGARPVRVHVDWIDAAGERRSRVFSLDPRDIREIPVELRLHS